MPSTRWTEVTVTTGADWLELISAALIALGANGVSVSGADPAEADGEWAAAPEKEAPVVRAYFPVDDLAGERIARLRSRLADAARELGPIPAQITLRPVAETDWSEAWKPYYHALRVGRIAIVPTWEDYASEPGEIVIRMDPGLAFGAGTHPTTQQSLSLLQRILRPGERVLDLGTGSGVLAIAAAALGAGPILARDIDPIAVAVARENAAANGQGGRFLVERGDLLAGLTGPFDLILANLIAPLHLALLPDLPPVLAPGGRAILAGIIKDRAAEVAAAAQDAGLAVSETAAEGEWVAMVVSSAL